MWLVRLGLTSIPILIDLGEISSLKLKNTSKIAKMCLGKWPYQKRKNSTILINNSHFSIFSEWVFLDFDNIIRPKLFKIGRHFYVSLLFCFRFLPDGNCGNVFKLTNINKHRQKTNLQLQFSRLSSKIATSTYF